MLFFKSVKEWHPAKLQHLGQLQLPSEGPSVPPRKVTESRVNPELSENTEGTTLTGQVLKNKRCTG